ncbi:MAG TPA: sodium:alanine symporter family protein [Spirochaetota bacterium]|mgnify:FL=1|nr:sodium:alanine symporter family protein [Spirochaetota bacterium]HPC41900.1 sodium:alanine symporter family protein [Spirochaetota bacterium]HPL17170.1 sodium:alanine symporter family protein [Spirochaetota bacterium]HQF09611.1 sodium:alanine symporter family protein [Spirochaetota bacterium]HQH98319.1 sodium:alanine symporter family protein [Spirochaetota bacterium]
MEILHDIIKWINGYLWGPPMLVILFGTHLFLTLRLRFIQRYVGLAIKLSFSRDADGHGDVHHFGALTTALAATIGTGNIVGVATAVALGGPGAVLWCWLTGVFGYATKYGEAVLSVKYRVKTSDGTMLGGPMYALERGLGKKWLAVLFCVFTSIAAFGIGNMVQANSISTLAQETLGAPLWVTGIFVTAITAIVILGGVQSIARVCTLLVPFMAFFYILGCLIILFINRAVMVDTLVLIGQSAFSPQAAGGGFIGASVMMAARYGIARGLFSNEAGLGSAPIVAAAAKTNNPVKQALVSATGTFWDTVVVCAITGMVLVSTIIRFPGDFGSINGAVMTKRAFAEIPVAGPIILTVGLLTFVYSTILGWSYYGERSVEYLFGKRSIVPYRVLWVGAVMVGSVVSLPLVWDLADMMNMLMAIPNLIALILLNGVIIAETRKFLWDGSIHDVAESFHEYVPDKTKTE